MSVQKTQICSLFLTGVRAERRGGATGGLSASATKAEEVPDAGGERLPPQAVTVFQEDGVDDERQQPLAAVRAHLETHGGNKARPKLRL